MVLPLPAPAIVVMPTAKRAALEEVAAKATAEEPNIGTDSNVSTYSEEACFYACSGPRGKPLVTELCEAEPEVSPAAMPEWHEEKKWEETFTPSNQEPSPTPPSKTASILPSKEIEVALLALWQLGYQVPQRSTYQG